MRILFVSNMNGSLDEGMRNVATHIARHLEKGHEVLSVGIREAVTGPLPKDVDRIVVSARAKGRTLVVIARLRVRYRKVRITFLATQPVLPSFLYASRAMGARIDFMFFSKSDFEDYRKLSGREARLLTVGVDQAKFDASRRKEKEEIRSALALPNTGACVLHVGHCSTGRGLEHLAALEGALSKVVVSSGMFDSAEVVKILKCANVDLRSGYITTIEQYYQASDVYFFPTTDRNFVISVPLSVLEALSCGVPVVALRGISAIEDLEVEDSRYLQVVDPEQATSAVLRAAALPIRDRSLIPTHPTWAEIGAEAEQIIVSERGLG